MTNNFITWIKNKRDFIQDKLFPHKKIEKPHCINYFNFSDNHQPFSQFRSEIFSDDVINIRVPLIPLSYVVDRSTTDIFDDCCNYIRYYLCGSSDLVNSPNRCNRCSYCVFIINIKNSLDDLSNKIMIYMNCTNNKNNYSNTNYYNNKDNYLLSRTYFSNKNINDNNNSNNYNHIKNDKVVLDHRNNSSYKYSKILNNYKSNYLKNFSRKTAFQNSTDFNKLNIVSAVKFEKKSKSIKTDFNKNWIIGFIKKLSNLKIQNDKITNNYKVNNNLYYQDKNPIFKQSLIRKFYI